MMLYYATINFFLASYFIFGKALEGKVRLHAEPGPFFGMVSPVYIYWASPPRSIT